MDNARNPMVIMAIFEFDSPLEINRLREAITTRFLCFDRFRQRVERPFSGIGKPRWVEDATFDLRSHIHRVALPAGGDKKALRELINDLSATPLDHTKPLWQIHLIEKFGAGCAVFWRIHHCIADGIALSHVMLSMTDTSPDTPTSRANDEAIPTQTPHTGSTILKKGNGTIKKIMSTGVKAAINAAHRRHLSQHALEAAALLEKQILMPSDPKTSFKGSLSSRKTVAWSDRLSLAQIKAMGNACDATVNDVLISAISGALRRYLIEKNNPVDGFDLHVSMPVNIREPGTEDALGNRFGVVSLALPVSMENPLERLKIVKNRNNAIKTSVEPVFSYQVLKMLGSAPAAISRRATRFFADKGTAVLSNVPGPGHPVYFAGKQIKNMMFWVPRTGDVAMGISILSYRGNILVGIASDADVIADPQQIVELVALEIQHLFDVLQHQKYHIGRFAPPDPDRQALRHEKAAGATPHATLQNISKRLSLGIRSIPFEKLSEKYIKNESNFINIHGTKIHYCDQGKGPVLILLHGILSSLDTWDAWTAILSPHYRIIRMDLPGFGLTRRLKAGAFSRDTFVDVFNQFVHALGLDRFDIAGNSVGGYLAWNYAMQYPEKVNKLVLIDAVGYPQALPQIMKFINTPLIRPIAGRMAPRFFFERSVRSIYGNPEKVTDKLVQRYYDMVANAQNRGAYVDMLRLFKEQCHSKKLCSGIETITADTLLMWGKNDPWVPVDVISRWEKDLHSSQTIIYEGVGHLPMEEIPMRSAGDARRFLEAPANKNKKRQIRRLHPRAA